MSIESLTERLFNPFELNSDDHYSPMFDIDPDMNYYNELDSHIALNCKYHFEETIAAAISDKTEGKEHNNVFSLCHANIRSLKANLPAFEVCLQTWISNFQQLVYLKLGSMTAIAICIILVVIILSKLTDPLKQAVVWWFFIRNNIPFHIRNDLNIHNEFCEWIL